MKKLLLTGATIVLLSSASAYANEFNLDVNLGTPAVVSAPAYIAPAPAVIVNPVVSTYDPHHRAHDWRYWHDRKERELHEHREHARDDHDWHR